jgi:Protein of unknown function DUF72
VTTYSVYLGAEGWEHPEWAGVLYPDDLPEDWRLAYYATQFRCVFLPAGFWTLATAQDIAGWIEETPPEFRFLLEEAPLAEAERLDAQAIMGDRLAGFFRRADPALVWFGASTDLRALRLRIDSAGPGGGALFLLSQDADVVVMERVRTLLDLLGV